LNPINAFLNARMRFSIMGVFLLVLWASVALISSCTAVPHPITQPDPRVIVIFGDSTSAPRGNIRIFAMILQDRMPSSTILNAGVPGNTTRNALARLDHDVISRHPDLVTIFFGINDSAVDVWKGATEPRVPLTDYEANLRTIVDRIRADGARPVLLTPNPVAWTPEILKLYGRPPYQPDNPDGWNIYLRRYADAVRRVATDEHVSIVDVDQMFRAYAAMPGHHLSDLLSDGMHPNDAGHQMIADGILKVIR
jgi:lysophospholipase L1-like esterase